MKYLGDVGDDVLAKAGGSLGSGNEKRRNGEKGKR